MKPFKKRSFLSYVCSLRNHSGSSFFTPLTPAQSNQLPFYALISFGCYLLGRLGVAILTFNDVPEAHEELQKEIEQAKTELRRQNVDVD